jgi:hypothetical protein
MIHRKFGEVVGGVEDIDKLTRPLLEELQRGIFRRGAIVAM